MAKGFLIPNETGFYRTQAAPILGGVAIDGDLSYTVVDDPIAAPDDESSRLAFAPPAVGGRFSLKLPRPTEAGLTNIGTISSLSIGVRARGDELAIPVTYKPFFRFDTVNSDGTGTIVEDAIYTFREHTFPINPFTGTAWSLGELERRAVEVGVTLDPTGGGGELHVTQIYAIIDYVPANWSRVLSASGSWSATAIVTGTWTTLPGAGGGWTKQ